MIRFLTTAIAVGLMLACGGVAQADIATSQDVGTPLEAGSWAYDAGTDTHTLTGGGNDIWGTADNFHFAYEEWTGDFTAQGLFSSTFLATDSNTTHAWAKSGIMARETLDANSIDYYLVISGHNGVAPQWRSATGGGAAWTNPAGTDDIWPDNVWLKVSRFGDFFQSYWAADDGTGIPPTVWDGPHVRAMNMPETINLGLSLTSHDDNVGQLHTSTVQNYTVEPVGIPFIPPDLVLADSPAGGMGFMGVREIVDNGTIGDQNAAAASINDDGFATIVEYDTDVLDRYDSGGRGRYSLDEPLGVVDAGVRTLGAVEDIAMIARGTIRIPTAGEYTFGVNSDDGFTLQFTGQSFKSQAGGGSMAFYGNGNALQFFAGRGAGDTTGVIDLAAGDHDFVLTWAERGGGAGVEFFAAQGAHGGWNAANFSLVGTPGEPAVVTENPPAVPGGWDVTVMYDDGTGNVDGIDNAISKLEFWRDFPAWRSPLAVVSEATGVPVIDYEDPDNDGGGKGFPRLSFPGEVPGTDDNRFGVLAEGVLEIVEAGTYTFTVFGDDGSRFLIDGTSGWTAGGIAAVDGSDTGIYIGGCCSDGYGTVDLAVGSYNMELIWNEIAGGGYVGVYGNEGAYRDGPFFQLGNTDSVTKPAKMGFDLVEAGMAFPVTSAADGVFSDGATWVDGVAPIATDDVNVNHAVTLAAPASVNSLAVNAGGALVMPATDGGAAGGVSAAADVTLQGDLVVPISGAAGAMFKAGVYTVVDSATSVVGSFANVTDLGDYVSAGENEDGVDYAATAVTLTIDKDLHPGDINLDTITDLSDFNLWNANKFLSDTNWTTGDVNGDGITDLSDFNLWNQFKFTSATGGAAPAPTQVPEPGTLALLACGLLGLLAWRRRAA